eukprot:1475483-Prymnesium_polylepis.1
MLHQSQRAATLATLALCAIVAGLFLLQIMPVQQNIASQQDAVMFTRVGGGYCRDANGQWPTDDHTNHCSLELSECKQLCVETGCAGLSRPPGRHATEHPPCY